MIDGQHVNRVNVSRFTGTKPTNGESLKFLQKEPLRSSSQFFVRGGEVIPRPHHDGFEESRIDRRRTPEGDLLIPKRVLRAQKVDFSEELDGGDRDLAEPELFSRDGWWEYYEGEADDWEKWQEANPDKSTGFPVSRGGARIIGVNPLLIQAINYLQDAR